MSVYHLFINKKMIVILNAAHQLFVFELVEYYCQAGSEATNRVALRLAYVYNIM